MIGRSFTTKTIFRNMPYIVFLALLGLVYIANAQYAERNMRKVQRLKVELKEYRWKYMSAKADLMYKSLQSQVEKEVADAGLHAPMISAQYKVIAQTEDTKAHE